MDKVRIMNITKTMAEQAAKLMAEKAFEDEMKVIHDDIREAYEFVLKVHVPVRVMAAIKEFPTWLEGTKSVYYYWNGCYYFEEISFFIPQSKKSIGCLLADVERENIQAKLQKLESVKEKCREFEDKCFLNLWSLKTRKRIEEIFPEAMHYIQWPSEPIKNLPAAQLEELRFALQKCRKG